MSVFEFNGRSFLLKTDKLSGAERNIYELLAQNKPMIAYPYEVETAGGERVTCWRALSDEDVRTLLDESDSRPPVERVCWEGTADLFASEYGTTAEVRRIAPVAHLPFICSIIDECMAASTYGMSMPVEDYVYLTRMVMENPEYDVKALQRTRPGIYARITDSRRMPRALRSTSLILLMSAEQTACRLSRTAEPEGDEIHVCEHEDGSQSHICMQVSGHEIVLSAETLRGFDIENDGLLVIKDTDKFKMRTGAYAPGSLLRAVRTMYHGLDTDLRHIAKYCDREKIEYIYK